MCVKLRLNGPGLDLNVSSATTPKVQLPDLKKVKQKNSTK